MSEHKATTRWSRDGKDFVVESYEDGAVGHLEKNAQSKMAIPPCRPASKDRVRWSEAAVAGGSRVAARQGVFHCEFGDDRRARGARVESSRSPPRYLTVILASRISFPHFPAADLM